MATPCHFDVRSTKSPTTIRMLTNFPTDPIPSNDPNDPLNWSTTAKITTYATICLFSFIANVNGSNFTVAIVPLEKHFHTNATHATFLVGFNVLMFGLGNILWVPLMRVLGKRPVYLLALAVFVAANAWSTRATSWGSLLGGRMVSGFGAAAADATVPSAVADMFFVDVRGHCMMFFHFALASGIFLGPLINAYVVQYHGWRWSTGWIAIVGGVTFLLAVFFIREPQYPRERRQYADDEIPARRSYAGWLSLTVGYNRDRPLQRFLTTFWDILRMALYPPVFWVGCLIGLFVGWTIVIQVTVSQTFVRPPYGWALGSVGLFSISGWLGVVLSFYFGGKLIDLIANRARTHDGSDAKLRPEKRLIALVIPFLLSPIGIIIFGQCIARRTHWIGPAFGYAMHSFGFTATSNIAITYAVDSYQTYAGEALVTVFVVRNVIAVICSFYSNVWIQHDGLPAVSIDISRSTYDEKLTIGRSRARWLGWNGCYSSSRSHSTCSAGGSCRSRTVTGRRNVCRGSDCGNSVSAWTSLLRIDGIQFWFLQSQHLTTALGWGYSPKLGRNRPIEPKSYRQRRINITTLTKNILTHLTSAPSTESIAICPICSQSSRLTLNSSRSSYGLHASCPCAKARTSLDACPSSSSLQTRSSIASQPEGCFGR